MLRRPGLAHAHVVEKLLLGALERLPQPFAVLLSGGVALRPELLVRPVERGDEGGQHPPGSGRAFE